MHHTVRRCAPIAALALIAAACSSSKSEPPPTDQPPPAAPAPVPVKVAPIDAAPAAAPAPALDAAPAAPNNAAEPEASPTPAATKPAPRPNDAPPENLKVLPRSWSRERVTKRMKQRIAPALGVKCTYCHDTGNFAKDTKKKRTARGMMRMVGEINRDFFGDKPRVSCMTCHMGKEEPAGE